MGILNPLVVTPLNEHIYEYIYTESQVIAEGLQVIFLKCQGFFLRLTVNFDNDQYRRYGEAGIASGGVASWKHLKNTGVRGGGVSVISARSRERFSGDFLAFCFLKAK